MWRDGPAGIFGFFSGLFECFFAFGLLLLDDEVPPTLCSTIRINHVESEDFRIELFR